MINIITFYLKATLTIICLKISDKKKVPLTCSS